MIYLDLFLTFFKIGLFTFGGGYAMIPMITQDVVAKGWLEASQITEFIGIAESTPGPFAINIATFVGMDEAGFGGASCATLGVVMPSFIIIYIIAKIFSRLQNGKSKLLDNTMSSVRPIVVGLIGVAFLNIFFEVCFGVKELADFGAVKFDVIALVIAVVMLLLTHIKPIKKKISPIVVIILSAVLGMIFYSIQAAVA